jgi:hypothetical protein
MQNAPPCVVQHDEYIEHSECCGWNGKEVN